MILFRLLLLWVVFLLYSTAHAKWNLVVEPYLGYSEMRFEEGPYAGQKSDQATVLGAKGGVLVEGRFYLALDYHTAGPYNIDIYDLELSHTMFGGGVAFVGKMFRLWVGLYPKNEVEDPNQFIRYTGEAMKFSAGLFVFKQIFMNIDVIQHDLKSKKQFSFDLVAGDPLNVSQLSVSVSAPIVLL